jgi:chemotaxis protein CheZ
MSDADSFGDSRELEALFDSIAAGVAVPARPRRAAAAGRRCCSSCARATAATIATICSACSIRWSPRATPSQGPATVMRRAVAGQDKVFQRVGQMARQLHDTLGELGYHELLEQHRAAIPDARDRLNYVAT